MADAKWWDELGDSVTKLGATYKKDSSFERGMKRTLGWVARACHRQAERHRQAGI